MNTNLEQVIERIRLVEVEALTRDDAILSLAEAACAIVPGLQVAPLIAAVEEREATAQTIVAMGLAIPHATLDFGGDYCIVLGRSRQGIEYGVPESGRVHLIALLVFSKQHSELHLELLATIAGLLGSEDFRQELIASSDIHVMSQLLHAKVSRKSELPLATRPQVPALSLILARQAIELCDAVQGQGLLFAIDTIESVPWQQLREWHGRILLVLSEKSERPVIEHSDTHVFEVPHTTLTRVDRANLGLLLAAAADLVNGHSNVICLTGPGGATLDSLTVMTPPTELEAIFGRHPTRRSAHIPPAIILRVLTLAIQLAAEGRESTRVGAMFVIGDSRNVGRHSRQLVLNPFHGYSRELRNILDPSLTETIKEFAFLDGAFVVEASGVVLSAGTYLTGHTPAVSIPQGLGTRHQAAAMISAVTKALAITVSQSTGTVTAFRNGKIVLALEHATPTRQ